MTDVAVPHLKRCDAMMRGILSGQVSLFPSFMQSVVHYLSDGAPDMSTNRAEFVSHVSEKTNALLSSLFSIVMETNDGAETPPPLQDVSQPSQWMGDFHRTCVKNPFLIGVLTGVYVTRPVGIGMLAAERFPSVVAKIPKEALLGASLVPYLDQGNVYLPFISLVSLGMSVLQDAWVFLSILALFTAQMLSS